MKLVDIHDLAARARRTVGEATPLPFGDKVVGLVLDRAGRVLDVVRNIEE